MFGLYVTVAIIAAGISLIAAMATAVEANSQHDRNLAKALPFIGIVGGALWPLLLALGVVFGLAYGGWHTARAVKHRGFDY